MKLSENNSYILAVIIVILGTLAIAAGFTVGLLSLTEFDDHVIIEDESPFDEIKPQSMDSPLSDDYIISTDYAIEELLISSDDTENPSRDVKIREAFDSADKFVKEGRWIFIDKGNFTLTLYDRERIIREWEIAIGIVPGDKQRKGDNRTPNGVFKIRQIQDSSKWTHDFGDGNGEIEGAYGPWFIRLYTPPWTGIGIHGTHDSDSINSRASEGCIRMNNYDVAELKALVKIGMPVVIVE